MNLSRNSRCQRTFVVLATTLMTAACTTSEWTPSEIPPTSTQTPQDSAPTPTPTPPPTPTPAPTPTPGPTPIASCGLDATWTRCTNLPSGSESLILQIKDGRFTAYVYNFKNANCNGMIDYDKVTATMKVGTLGASTSITGGTDLDVVMSRDVFSCGVGKPLYSVVKISKDCLKLQIPNPFGNCSAASRPTVLETSPLYRK